MITGHYCQNLPSACAQASWQKTAVIGDTTYAISISEWASLVTPELAAILEGLDGQNTYMANGETATRGIVADTKTTIDTSRKIFRLRDDDKASRASPLEVWLKPTSVPAWHFRRRNGLATAPTNPAQKARPAQNERKEPCEEHQASQQHPTSASIVKRVQPVDDHGSSRHRACVDHIDNRPIMLVDPDEAVRKS